MRVAVACEESQEVCKAFRARGHEAYSFDLQPCSGGHPEWHIQDDVLKHLDEKWDLLIGHPPCTYLCRTSEQWLNKQPERWQKMLDGVEFFKALWNADIPRIAIENPQPASKVADIIGVPYTQAVHPNYFGDATTKRTCLWLKNLPPLVWQETTDLLGEKTLVAPEFVYSKRSGRKWSKWFWESSMLRGEERAKFRSRTFPGLAKAAAEQWG